MRFALAALPAVAIALTTPTLAGTDDLPQRKAGQWEITMTLRQGLPPMVSRMCVDENTDRQMMQSGLASGDCSRMDVQRTADGYTVDAVCKHGAVTSTSHTVMTGDFQSSYKIVVSSDTTGGPANLPPHSTITQDARWTGACNGLQPGEVMLNGMTINVLKTMGGG